MSEPILHLATRLRKNPDSATPFDVRKLADWVHAAYRQKLREMSAGWIEEEHRPSAAELLGRADRVPGRPRP